MKQEYLSPSVELRRLIWVGPLTVLSSIAAVLFVRFVAVALLHPQPAFMPLTVAPPIVDTAVLVSLAVLVFRRVVFFALDPIGTYKIIAITALLLSFLPDIALAISHRAAWPYAFALMAMHVAAWAVCVPMLTKLTTTNAPQPEI